MRIFLRFMDKSPEVFETRVVTVVDGKEIEFEGEKSRLLDVFTGDGLVSDVLDLEIV